MKAHSNNSDTIQSPAMSQQHLFRARAKEEIPRKYQDQGEMRFIPIELYLV